MFHIRYSEDHAGASFKYTNGKRPAYIEFGMRGHKVSPLRFLEIIIHELKEIIQIEQGSRLTDYGESYQFHYSHKEHEDLCGRLAGLISKFIK